VLLPRGMDRSADLGGGRGNAQSRSAIKVATHSATAELAKIRTTASAAQYARGRRVIVREIEGAMAGVTGDVVSITDLRLPIFHADSTASRKFLVNNAKVNRTRMAKTGHIASLLPSRG
jgi:hypothetical protein